MRIDFDRYVPAGRSGGKTVGWLCAALGIAMGSSVLCFLAQYADEYGMLFSRTVSGGRVLDTSRTMAPFFSLLTNCDVGFNLILAAMPVLALFHYQYHWWGSKSIYLMRRLPSGWELHKRCLAVPFAGAVASMALLGLMCGVFYLIYILCTPAQCLPA